MSQGAERLCRERLLRPEGGSGGWGQLLKREAGVGKVSLARSVAITAGGS
jgi:hypothetical protein